MSTPTPEAPLVPPRAPGLYRWTGREFHPVVAPWIGPLLFAVVGIMAAFGIGHANAGFASVPSATVSATPTVASTPTPAPTPLALSGQGSKVQQADLKAGSCRVSWTAQGHDNSIVIVHGISDVHLVNQIPPSPASGEAFLKVSDSGSYPVEVQAATLSWTPTFTPL